MAVSDQIKQGRNLPHSKMAKIMNTDYATRLLVNEERSVHSRGFLEQCREQLGCPVKLALSEQIMAG